MKPMWTMNSFRPPVRRAQSEIFNWGCTKRYKLHGSIVSFFVGQQGIVWYILSGLILKDTNLSAALFESNYGNQSAKPSLKYLARTYTKRYKLHGSIGSFKITPSVGQQGIVWHILSGLKLKDTNFPAAQVISKLHWPLASKAESGIFCWVIY